MYKKRFDGRKFDEMRPIKMEVGVLDQADGSARFQIGDTIALAGVYGPMEMHPRRRQKANRAVLTCKYNMMSFSVSERKRMGPGRRDIELGLIMNFALGKSVLLDDFPKMGIEVHTEILQADSGTRCASICAASLALAHAGIPMRDLVSSIAVGEIGGSIVTDLTKKEEDYEGGATDIPIAYLPKDNEITLLQLDGNISPANLSKAIALGIESCKQITELQKKALRKKYSSS
jgi:exosome complex component RRP41